MTATPSLNHGLPSLAQYPHADIVVFDGHCRFCVSQMRLLARLDLRRQLAFLSLHDPLADLLLPDLSVPQRMKAIIVIDQAGQRLAGVDAFRYLAKLLPLLWPLAGLLSIPGTRPLWNWTYERVAHARYRFGRVHCEGGTCHLH